MSKKYNKEESEKLKLASSQKHEFSSSDIESISKMVSALNTLSKSNTVDKKINKRRKGAGAVRKKDN